MQKTLAMGNKLFKLAPQPQKFIMNTIKDKALVAQWREAKRELDRLKKTEMNLRLALADAGDVYDDGVLCLKVSRPKRITVDKNGFDKARAEWFQRFGEIKQFDRFFKVSPSLDKRTLDKERRELSAQEIEILESALIEKEGVPTIKIS